MKRTQKRLAPGLELRDGAHGTSPSLLIRTAASYATSAEVVLRSVTEHFATAGQTPALYLLAGFSIELALKAYILERCRDQTVIEKLSHDLEKAWHTANEHQIDLSRMRNSAENLDEIIRDFSPHHRHLTFRYLPEVKPFRAVMPPDLVQVSTDLCFCIAKQLDL
ncbi:hypothetical protein [Brevundimonas diminuta]|uniref:hypothetical protein n=1 Tax=Brevundimonas diminuta TaxID=293 RepID=UPI003D9A1486